MKKSSYSFSLKAIGLMIGFWFFEEMADSAYEVSFWWYALLMIPCFLFFHSMLTDAYNQGKDDWKGRWR